MKSENVIITNFLIERPKQIKLFEMKIPREADNIIGIETGLTWISGIPPIPSSPPDWSLPMTIQRNLHLGEIKFQSYEKANIFYIQELVMNQNLDYADFTSKFFIPKVYTHSYQFNEEPIKVNGNTTILQGVFRDKLADSYSGAFSYIVRVYVWYEAKPNN